METTMVDDIEHLEIDWQMPFCPEPPNWHLDWQAVVESFAWLGPLQECHQDPIWHAEGDVLTHTQMVCEALVESEQWRSLTPVVRSIVFAAALFHDVAKPQMTQEVDGRIRAPKHATKGAYQAREWLYQHLLPTHSIQHLHVREQIVDLVLHHGLPLYETDNVKPEQKLISVSQYCRLDWLAMLAEADVRGRICEDQSEMLDKIDLFRELCRETSCFDRPRSFVNGATRFAYFGGKWNDPDSPVFENWKCDVTIMSGLPGAGKDYWIRKFSRGHKIISLDKIRKERKVLPTDNQGQVASEAKETALNLLRRGEPFVWNATNLTREMRRRLVDLFSNYNANVKLQYVESPWKKLIAQNKERSDMVPRRIIEKMLGGLQPPRVIEATEVARFVNN